MRSKNKDVNQGLAENIVGWIEYRKKKAVNFNTIERYIKFARFGILYPIHSTILMTTCLSVLYSSIYIYPSSCCVSEHMGLAWWILREHWKIFKLLSNNSNGILHLNRFFFLISLNCFLSPCCFPWQHYKSFSVRSSCLPRKTILRKNTCCIWHDDKGWKSILHGFLYKRGISVLCFFSVSCFVSSWLNCGRFVWNFDFENGCV